MPVPCAGPKRGLGSSVSLQASAPSGGTAGLKPIYSDTMIYRHPDAPYSMCYLRPLIFRPAEMFVPFSLSKHVMSKTSCNA